MRFLLVLLCVALATRDVAAQPANVPDLIKLIENQPDGMDRSTWKEKRRDATRKLAQSKDKRGVPVLIKLAETETFDIVGEIAIEGLGTAGDPSAVPTLQGIVADTSRDKTSRDLAKKSLAKLGASETGPAPVTTTPKTTPTTTTTTTSTKANPTTVTTTTKSNPTTTTTTKTSPTTATTTSGTATSSTATTTTTAVTAQGDTGGTATGLETGTTDLASGNGGTLLGDSSGTTVENIPQLGDDVIAATNRLTFALGSVGLRAEKHTSDDNPDAPDKRLDFDADVKAMYERRLDTETRAYAINGEAGVVAGWVNPEGGSATRGAIINLKVGGEARFYSGKVYGIGKAVTDLAIQYISFTNAQDPNQNVKDTSTQFDLQIALGGGYGRLVDVGGAIRVRRLAALLDDARALGKPIDAATAKRLQLTWWALRAERSSFQSLIATIAILREAGVLLGEPNAVITYEILTVLRDTQLYMRPSGLDAQLVVGEGYLKRPDDDGGNCMLRSCGRVEQLIATVGYGEQLDGDKLEVSGNGFARYRLFADADMGQPTPYALGAGARMRRFTYGEHGDPFGALDLLGALTLSSDGYSADMNGGTASDKVVKLEAEAGFTYWMNQASGIRLAGQLVVEQGTYFLGARLEGTYGLLDAIYAR